jgi:hypothetical protein
MKHGRGIKGLDDKSSGMEILMSDDFVKINPTDPFILYLSECTTLIVYKWLLKLFKKKLNKQREENEIYPFSSDISWLCIMNRESESYRRRVQHFLFICNWIKKRRRPRANNVTLNFGNPV